MIYDCLTFMPVPANVDVVYETLPDSVSFTSKYSGNWRLVKLGEKPANSALCSFL